MREFLILGSLKSILFSGGASVDSENGGAEDEEVIAVSIPVPVGPPVVTLPLLLPVPSVATLKKASIESNEFTKERRRSDGES